MLGLCWCISRCCVSLSYPFKFSHIRLVKTFATRYMQHRLWGETSKRFRGAVALQSGRSRTICRFFDHGKHCFGPSRVARTELLEMYDCVDLTLLSLFHTFFVPKWNRIINFFMSCLICKNVALEKKNGHHISVSIKEKALVLLWLIMMS